MDRDPANNGLDERTRRDLAQLADGSLDGYRRAELEARLAGSPALRAAFARQRTATIALRRLNLEAPASLRARIEAETVSPPPRARRRRLALGGALAGAVAAAALAAVLIVPSGGGSPTVVEAARLSEGPATGSVGVDSYNPKLLSADVEGVPFPNWRGEFGWRQDGTRSDELDGRTARTVFYEQGGKRVAYTIVSGKGIPAPDGSRPATRNGVHLHALAGEERRVVTWWRGGRTCVLSSTDVGDHKLIKLASWKGDGAVPF